MKNILTKLLSLIAFILIFATNTFAADLGITSVTFDNSSSFLTINSHDNEDFKPETLPKLIISEEEQKVYFDINSSILRCPPQELILNSPDIKEIKVKQFSLNPNIVRVVISYSENFNPKNIKLLQVNNTLYVRFKQTKISNYYFQHIYSDLTDSVNNLYETIAIQTPVYSPSKKNEILDQINSAFNLGNKQNENNLILSKKNLLLHAKYYINNINIKPDGVHINGIGSATLSKPIRLSNPTRIAYDIRSTDVNPALRNNEFEISQGERIKIGQFDRNTARVVITSPNAQNYIPALYGDTQHLVFVNKNSTNSQSLFEVKSTLNNISDEINDDKTHSMKLVFSKPILYGVERNSDGLDIYLFNVEKSSNVNIKKSLIFDNANMIALKNGGFKLTITDKGENTLDIHTGTDGKSLRIKEKGNRIQLPDKEIIAPQIKQTPKTNGKYYIVLDPGHGGSDCGAIRNNIYEKNITLDVSKRVADLLRKKGYEVRMTRETDETVSLQDRVEFSENLDPDIFVSIHVNSSNSETPNGLETHYYKDNSLQLAKTIHASMLNHVSAHDRGLFKSKFYVINHTTAPAILVEIGFLSNPSERAQLVTESRKQATAKAIAEGIHDYFKK